MKCVKDLKEHLLSLCSNCLLHCIADAGQVSGIDQPVISSQGSSGAVTSGQREDY